MFVPPRDVAFDKGRFPVAKRVSDDGKRGFARIIPNGFLPRFLTRDRKQELHIPAFFFDGFDDGFTADRIQVSNHDFAAGCPRLS